MAITLTDRGYWSGYAADPDVPAAGFTPTEDNVLVVALGGWNTYVTGVTGWGETFTEIELLAVDNRDLRVFAVVVPASPGSDSATIDTGSTDWSGDAFIFELSGVDISSGVSGVFQQSIEEYSYGGGADNPIGTGFAAAFQNADCATLIVCQSANSSQTFGTMTGFTSFRSINGARVALNGMWYDGEELDPEYDPTLGANHDGAIAFELLATVAGGGATIPVFIKHMQTQGIL